MAWRRARRGSPLVSRGGWAGPSWVVRACRLSHELGQVEDPVAERQADAVDVKVLHLLQLTLGDPRVPVLRKGFWSRLLRQPKLHGWQRGSQTPGCGDTQSPPHPRARRHMPGGGEWSAHLISRSWVGREQLVLHPPFAEQ